jgi:general secretion pathway protein C
MAARVSGFVAAVAASWAWLSASPAAEEPAPAPIAARSAVPPAAVPPTRPPVPISTDGLILYGISGASGSAAAIIGPRLGGQRVVAVGHDYRPGLKLTAVGVDHAILRTGAQAVRLELSRFGAGGAAKATASLPAEEEQKIEAAVLRSILTPVRVNNRIGGYALRRGESLPQLIRAGLRPGDVIVGVNGGQLDEERMAELAWQMRNTTKTEFVFVRNGKKMRTTI